MSDTAGKTATSLRAKITAWYLASTFVVAFILLFSFIQIHTTQSEIDSILQDAVAASNASIAAAEIINTINEITLLKNQDFETLKTHIAQQQYLLTSYLLEIENTKTIEYELHFREDIQKIFEETQTLLHLYTLSRTQAIGENEFAALQLQQQQTIDRILALEDDAFLQINAVNTAIQTDLVRKRDKLERINLSIVALLILAVSVSVSLGLLSAHYLVAPIKALRGVMEQFVKGDVSVRANIQSRDEIGELATIFNTLAVKISQSQADLQKRIAEKTKELRMTVGELEKSQKATVNLLEDLNNENKSIEETVRKRTAELENERGKLASVTANMKDGAMLLDRHGQVVFANSAMQNMLESPNAAHTQLLDIFFEKLGNDSLRAAVMKCVSDGESGSVSKIAARGKFYDVLYRHLALGKDKHTILGTLIFVRDVTDETLLERSKSELVAVASHQLRTPLTAMRGNVEMLTDESYGKLAKEQKELLNDIEVSTVRLIGMVNDMLDITKIEKGDLEMKIEKFDVTEVVESILGDLGDYAKRHEFSITHRMPKKKPCIHGDVVRVRQVLQNLIDNAIKYSKHPGKLAITYRLLKKHLEIQLKDDGIGIPKAEQSNMFSRFYRASNTSKTTSSGSGLGLYIVKSIVEQLGGTIMFESEEDVGTTFFVTFPIAKTRTSSIKRNV